ncbi:hypothetical protein DH86_00000527 [Scytalidium sp. 3C]|nr:hypothetical protein DH86_00000527 [Scytalidium sp. 3C]
MLATTDMDEPTVLAKSQEYDGEVKKDTSSDSAHSKDGIKEKDGTVFTELPVYADEEGQQGEIHLDTAADIVTQAAGEAMSFLIPRWGPIGRFLNPGPFNMKEHAAIVIMASSASVSATSTLVIAAQKLYYGGYPNAGGAVFITMATQLLETLHKDKAGNKKRMKVFWIIFATLLVWEIVPEIFRRTGWLLTDEVSSFCVIMFMALYYGNIWNALDFPFLSQELFNATGANATNQIIYNQTLILNADNTIDPAAIELYGAPWLTASYVFGLITTNAGFTGNFVHMFLWNYAEIKTGWSFLTLKNIKENLSFATLKYFLTPSTYFFWRNTGKRTEEEKQALLNDPDIDPHYKVMIRNNYDECPSSWYFFAFLASFITVMACLYVIKSTLPWWGIIFAMITLWIIMLFFGAQYAMTGFGFNLGNVMQTIAGYCFPRAPIGEWASYYRTGTKLTDAQANMYFLVLTYNSLGQGQYLLRDLKLAQQAKLSPKCTFTTQMIGCVFGAVLNYIMMQSIVKEQTPILLSVEGTSIWSGAWVQSINSNGIAWAMAPEMFSFGQRYQWVSAAYFLGFLLPVPFYILHKLFPKQWIWSYLNLSIIFWYMGYLVVGVNSSVWIYFVIGYVGQWYFRKYRPHQFIKWNYLVSAGMDGGTQVMVFLLSFAVAGASGQARPFPQWWGNNINGNADRCAFNSASE